jgi:hypothetical protein
MAEDADFGGTPTGGGKDSLMLEFSQAEPDKTVQAGNDGVKAA